MKRLALIRHGHTHWNREGRIQGRTDIPLDDDASAGLAQLALPDSWVAADLCASPLARAMQTAKLIAGREATPIPALIEMNWGDWEGLHGLDLRADPASGFRDIENWGWDYRPPNGESPAEVWGRLQPWVDAISTDTVAVCHIGVMRVLLAQATGWGFDGPAPFTVKRNRLYVLNLEGGLHLQGDPVRLVDRAD